MNLTEKESIISTGSDCSPCISETVCREIRTPKLAQIVEGNPIPTFVVDSRSKVTHWNRACEFLTNIPADEIIGTDKHKEAFYCKRRKLLADLIVNNASDDELARQYGNKYSASKVVSDGYQGEDFFPKLGKNGKWLFFTGAPLKDAEGNIKGAIETIQDITDRRTAEQELSASEARYRQLFESANDAIFLLRGEVIEDCNQKALNLFDSSYKSMIGMSSVDVSPPIQPNGRSSRDEIGKKQKRLQNDVPQFFEWRFIRKDGSQFDAEVSWSRFKIAEVPHELAIIRDITKRKAMISALQERKIQLDEKRRYLEKVNRALKSSLDHREVEKRAVEESMLVNLKRFVFPYLSELERCKINSDGKAYVEIIKTNLNDIISRFSKTIFAKYMHFTPTEVRVADFVRDSKSTKEIADLLNLSPSSVKWHRKNIRKKLGLNNKKVNLYTYLNSLDN